MNAQDIVAAVSEYGVLLVFVNVLLERLGLPLPATPTLLVAGALAGSGSFPAAEGFAAAAVASTIGDSAWFALGRAFGKKVLNVLCRVALAPDSCARRTERQFDRWGVGALIVAKFIPGLSTVARPLAGSIGVSWAAFSLFNGLGTVLWAATALGTGFLLKAQIVPLLARLVTLGSIALALLGVGLLTYLVLRWRERIRFSRSLPTSRIEVDQLVHLMQGAAQPMIVDVRSRTAQQADPRQIPGAVRIDLVELALPSLHLPADRDIVLYCACPNEASAARAAGNLHALGLTRAHPLRGGLEAWLAAGQAIEYSLPGLAAGRYGTAAHDAGEQPERGPGQSAQRCSESAPPALMAHAG